MNLLRAGLLTIVVSTFFFSLSCVSVPPVEHDREYDYTTNGFLGDHRFQTTALSKPDTSAKGLVAQRESALIKARNELQKKTIESLIQYRLGLYLSSNGYQSEEQCPDVIEVKKILYAKIISFVSFGKIVEEYYEKDNSAWVVFRIEKTNLRKSLEDIEIKLPKEENKGDGK